MRTDNEVTRMQRDKALAKLVRLGIGFPEWFAEATTPRELAEFTATVRDALARWLRHTGNDTCIFEGCGMKFNPHIAGKEEGTVILTGWQEGKPDAPDLPGHTHQLRSEGGLVIIG